MAHESHVGELPAEPGMVVFWRLEGSDDPWQHGVVARQLDGVYTDVGHIPWVYLEWAPAPVLGPLQVAADIPPTDRWRDGAQEIWLEWHDLTDELSQPSAPLSRSEVERLQDGRFAHKEHRRPQAAAQRFNPDQEKPYDAT